MKNSERLSNCVREHRLRLGIRQSDLAEQVSVTRQTIIAIEKERFNPSVALALRIAQALGESVDHLFSLAPHAEEVPVATSEVPTDAPPEQTPEPAAAPAAFEALTALMGPAEENVSPDCLGPLPSPLDGTVTEPVQAIWDF